MFLDSIHGWQRDILSSNIWLGSKLFLISTICIWIWTVLFTNVWRYFYMINWRMILSYSNLKFCLNSLNRYGLKYSTTSIWLWICSNQPKWYFWLWMVLHLAQKWTINDLDALRVLATINSFWRSFMAINKETWIVNKISKITLFLPEQSLWKISIKWSTFSYRRRLKKMTIGKIFRLFLQAVIVQAKDNIKSWSGLDPTNNASNKMTITVYMELMLT